MATRALVTTLWSLGVTRTGRPTARPCLDNVAMAASAPTAVASGLRCLRIDCDRWLEITPKTFSFMGYAYIFFKKK